MEGDAVMSWPQLGSSSSVVGPLTQTLRNPLPLRRWRSQAGFNPQGLNLQRLKASMLIHTANIAKLSFHTRFKQGSFTKPKLVLATNAAPQ